MEGFAASRPDPSPLTWNRGKIPIDRAVVTFQTADVAKGRSTEALLAPHDIAEVADVAAWAGSASVGGVYILIHAFNVESDELELVTIKDPAPYIEWCKEDPSGMS